MTYLTVVKESSSDGQFGKGRITLAMADRSYFTRVGRVGRSVKTRRVASMSLGYTMLRGSHLA
jgi:hypothetical protein